MRNNFLIRERTVRSFCVALSMMCFLAAPPADAVDRWITVPEGDLAALKSELLDAQTRTGGKTTLRVRGDFVVSEEDELPAIVTEVWITANHAPARFVATGGGPGTLLRVTGTGDLHVVNVGIEGFDLAVHAPDSGSGPPGLLINHGKMHLDRVQFSNNISHVSCSQSDCSAYKPVMLNTETGDLGGGQISIINSGAIAADELTDSDRGGVISNAGTVRLSNVQLYLNNHLYEPPLENTGQMWLSNASIKFDQGANQFKKEWIVSPGRLQLSNSIISGFSSDWCGAVISAGFNLVDDPRCQISSRDDIVGKPAGLRWQRVDSRWTQNNHEGVPEILTHALVPIAASAAVDSANDDWCPIRSIDYLSTRSIDGDGDNVGRCDRGTFEIGQSIIDNGGINGLYFNPEANGHYVYIADTRYNTMVMWTTFDAQGRQAWIFGIADRAVAGRSLIADAYINRDGRVSLAGEFDPATSEHWGRIEVEMSACGMGEFTFYSDVPGFGSGAFEFVRLAHVKQLGCSDFAPEH